MTITNKVLAVYVGDHKSDAMRAYRLVFGVDLAESKKAVENRAGMLMTTPVLAALREQYCDGKDVTHWQINGITKASDPMGIADK